jgi:hypothetical protein
MIIFSPQARQFVIHLIEQRVLHREVNYMDIWMNLALAYAKMGVFLILTVDFFVLLPYGKQFFRGVSTDIRSIVAGINLKLLWKPFLIISGIYLLGLFCIVRANVPYIDDMARSVEGYRYFNWSRHLSDLLSIFVHADIHVTDISPLPQLLAALLLGIASMTAVYVLNDGKITVPTLLASIPLGLSPYYLECLSFKFDAPYMALSVLASVVPFLFVRSRRAFVACSIPALLVMSMTYQASSGIYLMMAILLAYRYWNDRQSCKTVFSFLGVSLLSFCCAMSVFGGIFMLPSESYASTAMNDADALFGGAWANLHKYFLLIRNDFGMIWKIVIAVICVLFVFQKTKKSKPIAVIVSLCTLALLFVASYGIYLLLQTPLFSPRAMFGFGVFLALTSICVAERRGFFNVVAVFMLNWCLLTFAFSYGNALADQHRYAQFRTEMLLHDLSDLFPDRTREEMSVQIKGAIDFAPSVRNIARRNPVITRLTPLQLRQGDIFGYYYLLEYFNWGIQEQINDFWKQDVYVDFRTLDMPVLRDTYYHTILSDGERILVELKTHHHECTQP